MVNLVKKIFEKFWTNILKNIFVAPNANYQKCTCILSIKRLMENATLALLLVN